MSKKMYCLLVDLINRRTTPEECCFVDKWTKSVWRFSVEQVQLGNQTNKRSQAYNIPVIHNRLLGFMRLRMHHWLVPLFYLRRVYKKWEMPCHVTVWLHYTNINNVMTITRWRNQVNDATIDSHNLLITKLVLPSTSDATNRFSDNVSTCLLTTRVLTCWHQTGTYHINANIIWLSQTNFNAIGCATNRWRALASDRRHRRAYQ